MLSLAVIFQASQADANFDYRAISLTVRGVLDPRFSARLPPASLRLSDTPFLPLPPRYITPDTNFIRLSIQQENTHCEPEFVIPMGA